MKKKWNSSLLRNDSEITPYLQIPPGHNEIRLPVLRNINIALSALPEDMSDIQIEHCTIRRPERYHECDVHAIFLLW